MNRVSAAIVPPSKSTASKYSSDLTQSLPASASPESLGHSLRLHLQTRSITASKCIFWVQSISATKCISEFIRSRSPSASQPCSIKYIFKERRRLYGDTGVTEVDRVTGSIYLADPGVDRHHLISISSYHTMKIHTLCFRTFDLTRYVRDPRNCVDPHGRVLSYLLTFLHSSSLM